MLMTEGASPALTGRERGGERVREGEREGGREGGRERELVSERERERGCGSAHRTSGAIFAP